ncbi:transcriptional regulator sdnM [Penicillium riverlandense]|uniref:transcriptional regulator sdnM n=1 Tax=Penicillium riverlandense TaxID=1903569 RepID=UPI0025498AC8|nr:transcriptional regulator sdnM [Penicillium riverlandense]KAJ5808353.1 transcriptional regulator sdnM [Penicillium riverlandense]
MTCNNPEHDVYPLHALDDIQMNHIFLSWIMCFNDVLDAQKLKGALSRLLEIGDWRKLGGRLKFKENGKLEIHVPRHFTAERPAVAFSHDHLFEMSIEDHPVAQRFPKPTGSPSIQPVDAEFRQFAARPDFPKTIKDSIRQDAPQLSLHITSFHNATLVALAWPHTLMDAMGQQALLRAWSLVLAGREDQVPPMLGAREDALMEATEKQSATRAAVQEELILESKRLGYLGVMKLISRFIWDKVRNPAPELRMIYVPKNAFARLQNQSLNEAAAESITRGAFEEKVFVSEGDILTAWVTRVVSLSEPKPRPVTVGSLLNTRFRIPLLKKTEGVYIQNMTLVAYAFLSSQQARASVGSIALAHRRHLAEQATEQQTLSFLRALRQDIDAGKSPRLFFGESDSLPVLFNNLTKAELIKAANFGAAVLRQGEKTESRANPPGTMVCYYNRAVNQPTGVANAFYMLGKDYSDNYWLMGNLLPRTWTKIEEELTSM